MEGRFGIIKRLVMGAAIMAFPVAALATNGYFTSGQTLQQMAMGGAGTAFVANAGVVTENPAGAAWVGTQFDFGFGLFEPQRSYQAYGTGAGAGAGILTITPTNGALRSENRHFYIPGMTFNYRMNDKTSIGVAMYGNGGLDTKYNGGSATFAKNLPLGLTGLNLLPSQLAGALPASFQVTCGGTFGGGAPVNGQSDPVAFCGNSASGTIAGVDLIQMFIAPYYARKITPRLSIGVEPLIAVQRFKASGLAAFRTFSNKPDDVTDRGYSYSIGGGVRVGFLWNPIRGVGIGGSYQSHVFMTRFGKYKGLFAGKGGFDIPENFNVGVQFHPFRRHRFIFDFQRIFYHEIASVGDNFNSNAFVNKCAEPRLLARLTGGLQGSTAPNPYCLGGDAGPGFGWRDMNVYKFGYQFQYHHLKLRLGYSFSFRQPIGANNQLFNILATGVIRRHLTAGFAYQITHAITVAGAFVYAFGHSTYGKNPLSNTPGQIQVPGSNGDAIGLKFDSGIDPDDQTIRLYMRQFRAAMGFTYHFR